MDAKLIDDALEKAGDYVSGKVSDVIRDAFRKRSRQKKIKLNGEEEGMLQKAIPVVMDALEGLGVKEMVSGMAFSESLPAVLMAENVKNLTKEVGGDLLKWLGVDSRGEPKRTALKAITGASSPKEVKMAVVGATKGLDMSGVLKNSLLKLILGSETETQDKMLSNAINHAKTYAKKKYDFNEIFRKLAQDVSKAMLEKAKEKLNGWLTPTHKANAITIELIEDDFDDEESSRVETVEETRTIEAPPSPEQKEEAEPPSSPAKLPKPRLGHKGKEPVDNDDQKVRRSNRNKNKQKGALAPGGEPSDPEGKSEIEEVKKPSAETGTEPVVEQRKKANEEQTRRFAVENVQPRKEVQNKSIPTLLPEYKIGHPDAILAESKKDRDLNIENIEDFKMRMFEDSEIIPNSGNMLKDRYLKEKYLGEKQLFSQDINQDMGVNLHNPNRYKKTIDPGHQFYRNPSLFNGRLQNNKLPEPAHPAVSRQKLRFESTWNLPVDMALVLPVDSLHSFMKWSKNEPSGGESYQEYINNNYIDQNFNYAVI